jgi:hypothetical protein
MRKKADHNDKDYTETIARWSAFSKYKQHYDRISQVVDDRNRRLKEWGPEQDAAVAAEVEAGAYTRPLLGST